MTHEVYVTRADSGAGDGGMMILLPHEDAYCAVEMSSRGLVKVSLLDAAGREQLQQACRDVEQGLVNNQTIFSSTVIQQVLRSALEATPGVDRDGLLAKLLVKI